MSLPSQNKKIIPVLLGADLNCYSMARAFHEAFGVCSYAFGRYRLGTTASSAIVRFTVVEDLSDDRVLLQTLLNFAATHKNNDLYLIGCTDAYAEMIIRNHECLSSYYFCPSPNAALTDKLISKQSFYEVCASLNVDYPCTVVMENLSQKALLSCLPFAYPIVIKPSSSIRYWEHPFPQMKKVYLASNQAEAEAVVDAIFASGYDDSLVLQDYIPGDDSGMYVLTAYSDQSAKVRMMALGHVLLEEHTPKGLGNHVAILTEHRADVMEKLRLLLETVGYTGFSNFDIKFDPRDGKYKVFEINLRQGRSNGYMKTAGINPAKVLVCDRENRFDAEMIVPQSPSFWYTVPKKIIYSYIHDDTFKKQVKSLVRAGKSGTSLFYAYDLIRSPKRLLYVLIHNNRYYKKYRLYP